MRLWLLTKTFFGLILCYKCLIMGKRPKQKNNTRRRKIVLWPSSAPPGRRGRCCICRRQREVRCTAWCQLGPQMPSQSFLSCLKSLEWRRWNVWRVKLWGGIKSTSNLNQIYVVRQMRTFAYRPFNLVQLGENRVDNSDGVRWFCAWLAGIPGCCQTLHLPDKISTRWCTCEENNKLFF